MKTFKSIAPLAAVLIAGGVAIAWLIGHHWAAGPWLLAAVLLGHGWVHVMFFFPKPAPKDGAPEWPFDLARSWPATRIRLDLKVVRFMCAMLAAAVLVGFVAAALSTVGIVLPVGMWPALVLFAATVSALMLTLFFDLQLMLGLAIDAVLIWVVVAGIWLPA